MLVCRRAVLTVLSHLQATVSSVASNDRVRRIVQEEGRSARNLIAYNVPARDESPSSTSRGDSLIFVMDPILKM